jgi:DNA polymerase
MAQINELHEEFDILQNVYGDTGLHSIYGAGQISNPEYCFVFMNPTGRNVSAVANWKGLRAPWIGTKQVWKLFVDVGLLPAIFYQKIEMMKPSDWTEDFAEDLYEQLSAKSVYITNLAKCTQLDARPLKDSVFKQYRDLFMKELALIKPKRVISFGNQVSSIILEKKVSVSSYILDESESLCNGGESFSVYPTYYPVGQGRRNLPMAVKRICSL